MKQTILIDTSLTGGRGPAKKTYEFVQYCQENGITYRLLTNRSFLSKLAELGIKPDYTIDVNLAYGNNEILEQYKRTLQNIKFDSMVRFGARVPGPTFARINNIPYVIVDGGLPDRLEPGPSLYDRDTFKNAKKYIVTSQFPWNYPLQTELQNIQVGFFTLSQKTYSFVKLLREMKRQEIIKKYLQNERKLENILNENVPLINLMMTSNYIADPFDRITYGAWLNAKDYDACVGFIRRLATDLALVYKKKIALFVDSGIKPIIKDIAVQYPNLSIISYESKWKYETEIVIQKLATINISRATNYQPFIALLGNGGSITSPVPSNGYMNEDSAVYQYKAFGMTEVIEYDDEQYVSKLLTFMKDRDKQKEIATNQIRVSNIFLKKYNSADLAAQALNLNTHV